MKYLKRFNESLNDDIQARIHQRLDKIDSSLNRVKPQTGGKFCHECGTKLEKDSAFCGECGQKQESTNANGIQGILKYILVGEGSKSEGYKAYLELPQYTNKTTNEPKRYKLYRKGVYEINDDYFKKFNNKEVVVEGEVQKGDTIMVKNINLL